jgi:hypothetical protein
LVLLAKKKTKVALKRYKKIVHALIFIYLSADAMAKPKRMPAELVVLEFFNTR